MASEIALISSQASVMVYDDQNKKWISCGREPAAISKVQIFLNQSSTSYRIVGRKGADQEVVINCAIPKGLKYNQATATFHQWRDKGQVYGLNFVSKQEADGFASAMLSALDVINSMPMAPAPEITSSASQRGSSGQAAVYQTQASIYGNTPPVNMQAGYQQQQQGGYAGEDSEGFRLRSSQSDAYQEPWRGGQPSQAAATQQQQPAGWGNRGMQQQQQQREVGSSSSSVAPQAASIPEYAKPQQPAPQMAPIVAAAPAAAPPQPPIAAAVPPAPPAPPMGGPPAPPPPPPPPPPPGMPAPAQPPMPPSGGPPSFGGGDDAPQGSFAAQLRAATLKKTQQPVEKSDDASASGRGPAFAAGGQSSVAMAPPGGGGGGDLMSEIVRKLAARKAKEGSEGSEPAAETAASRQQRPPPSFATTANGLRAAAQDSPKMQRSQSIISSQDVPAQQSATLPRLKGRGSNAANAGGSSLVNGGTAGSGPTFTLGTGSGSAAPSAAALANSDLEQLKQEILAEIRRELAQLKLDIIEGVRQAVRAELGH